MLGGKESHTKSTSIIYDINYDGGPVLNYHKQTINKTVILGNQRVFWLMINSVISVTLYELGD